MTACSTSPKFFRRAWRVLVIVALQYVTHGRMAVNEKDLALELLSRSATKRGSPEQYQELHCDRRTRIEHDVVYGAGARRQETLMPLVEAGHDGSPDHGQDRPT